MSTWGYQNSLGDPRLTVALLTSTNVDARTVAQQAFFGQVSGVLAATLGAVTLVSAGTVAAGGGVSGELAATLGAVTVSSAGTVAVTGALAATLGGVTLASAGAVAVSGTLAATLGAVTLASAGRAAVAGTSAATLGAVTLASVGTVAVQGTAAITLGAVTLSSAGTVSASAVSGSLAATLGAVTLASAGVVSVLGTSAPTLGAVTLSAAGVVTSSYVWLSASARAILDAVTTPTLIRDRIITVLHGLTPDTLVRDRFRVYRDEGDGDFITWAEAAKAGALRRFQVLDTFDDQEATTSDTLVEDRLVTFEILVAYPQTNRAGGGAALDRMRMMREDQKAIEDAVGLRGYANFAGSYPNASWMSGSSSREVRDGVDILLVRQTMRYYLLVA